MICSNKLLRYLDGKARILLGKYPGTGKQNSLFLTTRDSREIDMSIVFPMRALFSQKFPVIPCYSLFPARATFLDYNPIKLTGLAAAG